MSEKRLGKTLRLFMIQYGNRVVDVEWVIKLNKQGVSEKSIAKLLKLIILGTVNMIWVLFVNLHASVMNVRRNSIELLFWQLNKWPQIPKGALF